LRQPGSKRPQKAGRPAIPQKTVDLVMKLAKENLRWGYKRSQDASSVLHDSPSGAT
jgi:hypothetical protein